MFESSASKVQWERSSSSNEGSEECALVDIDEAKGRPRGRELLPLLDSPRSGSEAAALPRAAAEDVRVTMKNTFLEFGLPAPLEFRRSVSMPALPWDDSWKLTSSDTDAEPLPNSSAPEDELRDAQRAPENENSTSQAAVVDSEPQLPSSASGMCMYGASPFSRYFEGSSIEATEFAENNDRFYMGSYDFSCSQASTVVPGQAAAPMMVLVPVWGPAPCETFVPSDVHVASSAVAAQPWHEPEAIARPMAGSKGNAKSNAYAEGPKAVFVDLSKLRPSSAAARKVSS